MKLSKNALLEPRDVPVIVLGVVRVHCRAGCGFGEMVRGIAPSHPPKGVSVGISSDSPKGVPIVPPHSPKGVSVGITLSHAPKRCPVGVAPSHSEFCASDDSSWTRRPILHKLQAWEPKAPNSVRSFRALGAHEYRGQVEHLQRGPVVAWKSKGGRTSAAETGRSITVKSSTWPSRGHAHVVVSSTPGRSKVLLSARGPSRGRTPSVARAKV